MDKAQFTPGEAEGSGELDTAPDFRKLDHRMGTPRGRNETSNTHHSRSPKMGNGERSGLKCPKGQAGRGRWDRESIQFWQFGWASGIPSRVLQWSQESDVLKDG